MIDANLPVSKDYFLDYSQHPAFTFGDESLQISKASLTAFDRDYAQITAQVTANQLAAADGCSKLGTRISEIFEELRSQSHDSYELLFLKQLEIKTLALLGREFEYYELVDRKKYAAAVQDKSTVLQQERHYFGKIKTSTVDKILGLSQRQIDSLRQKVEAGLLDRENLSVNQGEEVISIVRALNSDFKSQGVLAAVSQYMGHDYRVGSLALELSTCKASWWQDLFDNQAPPKTLYVHLDESINFPKAIVYLSDVSEVNGPTCCYPHVYEGLQLNALQELIGRIVCSVWKDDAALKQFYDKNEGSELMSSEQFRRHFMKLPAGLRFNCHFGWDVISGSELESKLMSCEHKMTGPPGTFIVFDGAKLLHRGGLLERGERIALQVIFTPVPRFANRLKSLVRRIAGKIWRRMK